jgi:hypothetical protein
MTALELMERLGGEIVMNRVRVVVDGKLVVAAILNGTEWEATEEGTALMNLHSNLVVEEAAVVAKPSRKKGAPAVESTPVVETPTAETEPAPAE